MLHRIINLYNSGIFAQKICFQLIKKFNISIAKSYRFKRRFIHKYCSKIIFKRYNDKNEINYIFKNTFSDFSNFANYIDKEQKDDIISSANKYLNHTFNLLGSGDVKLESIDWHFDFKSGYRWGPGKFYKDYVQEKTPGFADVKVTRELSRCHHFLLLGEAYLITKDEKYTKEFLSQILDWIDENPLMYSINWGCTMDVSIRAVNWIWSLGMFIDSNLLSMNKLIKIFISLYEHGWYIYRHPEKSFENNHNHYISDLVGQIFLGILFRDLSEPKRWLKVGMRELFKEMRWQILPSGVDYERSTSYHRLVNELLTSAIIILKRNNFEIPLDIWYRLEKMHEFVMYYMKPDGTAPIIGDQDNGRLNPFSISKDIDHRHILSVGSIIFNRADFKKYSKYYISDCFFLLGEESKKILIH